MNLAVSCHCSLQGVQNPAVEQCDSPLSDTKLWVVCYVELPAGSNLASSKCHKVLRSGLCCPCEVPVLACLSQFSCGTPTHSIRPLPPLLDRYWTKLMISLRYVRAISCLSSTDHTTRPSQHLWHSCLRYCWSHSLEFTAWLSVSSDLGQSSFGMAWKCFCLVPVLHWQRIRGVFHVSVLYKCTFTYLLTYLLTKVAQLQQCAFQFLMAPDVCVSPFWFRFFILPASLPHLSRATPRCARSSVGEPLEILSRAA